MLVYRASATKIDTRNGETAIKFIQQRLLDSKNDVFQQIYLSPNPYYDAFQERLDLQSWNQNNHVTPGLWLIQDDNRALVTPMDPI